MSGRGQVAGIDVGEAVTQAQVAVGNPGDAPPDAARRFEYRPELLERPGVAVAGDHAGEAVVHTRLAAHEYPREVEFIDALPMTATGKIQRRLLRDG